MFTVLGVGQGGLTLTIKVSMSGHVDTGVIGIILAEYQEQI